MNKLLTKIANSFSGLNKAVSCSINLSNEENEVVGGLFSFINNEINLEVELNEIPSDELKKLPIIITIEGKGVLNKFVELPLEKIRVRNIIPNLKEDDFYINYTPNLIGTWVSLVRKDSLDKILNQHKIPFENIIDLHIGPSCIQWLSGISSELPSKLGDSLLKYSENTLVDIEKRNHDEPITSKLLGLTTISYKNHLPLVSALVSLANLNKLHKGEIWNKNTQNQKDKKAFYSTVKVSLGLLLLVFMGNLVANQMLERSYNENIAKSQTFESLNNEAKLLKEEVKSKEAFVKDLGLGINPQFGFFVDEIGQTVPKKIQLNQININPLSKSIRNNKLIEFGNGTIILGGFCQTPQTCNEWVSELRELNWANKIELKEFKFNKDNIGEFQIIITF